MSRIQKFRMFNAGSYTPSTNYSSYNASSFNPMARASNSYTPPSFMNRMGTGYNRMQRIESPDAVQRMVTRPTPTPQPTTNYTLGTGDSRRSISGATFRGVAKRAKSKKEPLCDCGMPISQCQCDGHDHKAKAKTKAKKSTRTSSVKKAAPPDYLTIYGNQVQNYANRLNANQRKLMPPPLYPQTFGATVNIGNDGGLSGYTSLYNSQKGSAGSTMRKGRGFTKARRIRVPLPDLRNGFRPSSPIGRVSSFKPKAQNLIDEGMIGLARRYHGSKEMYDALGNPKQMLRIAAGIEGKKLKNSAKMFGLNAVDNLRTKIANPIADKIGDLATRRYGAGSREAAMINQFRANPKDKSWRGNPKAMIGRIASIERGRVGQKVDNVMNMSLRDIANRVDDAAVPAYALANKMRQGGRQRIMDFAQANPDIARVIVASKPRYILGGTIAGLALNNMRGSDRNEPTSTGAGMKKSITRMGRHVVGGYRGKSISKAMKSSQTNLSNKYM